MDLGVTVKGERELDLAFDEFPKRAHDALLKVITRAADQLEEKILARVPRKTGALAAAIVKQITDQDDKIIGAVSVRSSNRAVMAAAGVLEYGSDTTAHVKAHQMMLDHVFDELLNRPMNVLVEAYNRPQKILDRKYLRSPFDEMADGVEAEMRAAVDDLIGDSDGQ